VTGLGPIQTARQENEPIVWMGYVGKLDDKTAKPILAGKFTEVNPESEPEPAQPPAEQMADLEQEIVKAITKRPRARKPVGAPKARAAAPAKTTARKR
jgi:hypothetical protein